MAPLVDAFQKANPNIKVNVQYLPQATLGQATVTALQAGNAADVLYSSSSLDCRFPRPFLVWSTCAAK